MNRLLFLCLAFFPIQTFGCKCGPSSLMDTYQESDFVAVVKILKATPDPKNDTYRTVEIETIDQYKGTPTKSLLVNIEAHTSCAFSIPENSTWLVFARKGENGALGFGACSGSKRTEPTFVHPRAAQEIQKDSNLKVAVLNYMKTKGLENFNPYQLTLNNLGLDQTAFFRRFENKNQFAVYELDVNEDLSIEAITPLQSFENPKLAQLFSEYLRKNARVNNSRRKEILHKSTLVVIFYYYPAEGLDTSFVSQYLWLW